MKLVFLVNKRIVILMGIWEHTEEAAIKINFFFVVVEITHLSVGSMNSRVKFKKIW